MAAALEHEPELDVLRVVLGVSSAIGTRAESAICENSCMLAVDCPLHYVIWNLVPHPPAAAAQWIARMAGRLLVIGGDLVGGRKGWAVTKGRGSVAGAGRCCAAVMASR